LDRPDVMRAKSRANRRSGVVPPDEGERIAAGVGALIREQRTVRGWTAREVSRRAGMAHATVDRIEAGTIRPRGSTLDALARVLAERPEDIDELAARLRASAGDSLARDTSTSLRRAARRVDDTAADAFIEQLRRAAATDPRCPWCGR